MNPVIESTVMPDLAIVAAHARRARRNKWRTFGVGMGVLFLGLALIWLGDGSSSMFRKAVVVFGVILSVGGIAVLRFLLLSSLRKRK